MDSSFKDHLKTTCYCGHKIYQCYIHWEEPEPRTFPCPWRYKESCQNRSLCQATLETLTNLPFPPRCKDTIMFDHRPRTLAQEHDLVRHMVEAPRGDDKQWLQREIANNTVGIDTAASTSSAFMASDLLLYPSKVALFQFSHGKCVLGTCKIASSTLVLASNLSNVLRLISHFMHKVTSSSWSFASQGEDNDNQKFIKGILGILRFCREANFGRMERECEGWHEEWKATLRKWDKVETNQ